MLQMNCPECKGVIKSPYLVDLSSIDCTHCKEHVAVKDVFVATEGFSMHRDDLLNRISRFQKLLGEVEKEIQVLQGNENVSKTTQSSINKFYKTLQELLSGARSNYRLDIPDGLAIEMDYNDHRRTERLVNLSTLGASLELDTSDNLPRNRAEIKLQLDLPDVVEPLSLRGKVVWIRKVPKDETSQLVKLGVKFLNLDDNVRDILWNYIISNSPVTNT